MLPSNKTQERHSIKSFRGTKLGIIRLNELAYPSNDKMKIMVGDSQVFPIGFDTYGHPIISESNFAYYQAQKENTERQGESFVPTVEYEIAPFCIKKSCYDCNPNINKSIEIAEISDLKSLKQILIFRKQAVFTGETLNNFLLYNKYLLSRNGKIYEYQPKTNYEKDIVMLSEEIDTSSLKETHLPGENDKCDICGKEFSLGDVKNFAISENEKCAKVHKKCLCDYTQALEHQKASRIIDSVYDGKPISEVIKDEEKNITWFAYKTEQGTISIRFKTKVIVIEWKDNFKPFNMSIFDNERVTKFDRGIHAWSKDDAIRYLGMAKKA